jgi:hypothetical protein
LSGRHPLAAFVSYSRFEPHQSAKAAWIVVSYGISAMPSMSSTPVKTDETVIFDDRTLRSLAIIDSLPSRCM